MKKAQMAIGFCDLSNGDFKDYLAEDMQALSPLFESHNAPAAGQIPQTPVLFLYSHFIENGTLASKNNSGVRQIAQLTGCKILIVASPVPDSIIQKVMSVAGPKTANIAFMTNRNHFTEFFIQLFTMMNGGQEFLSAWVTLVPQIPNPPPGYEPPVPGHIMIAEAGKLSFIAPPPAVSTNSVSAPKPKAPIVVQAPKKKPLALSIANICLLTGAVIFLTVNHFPAVPVAVRRYLVIGAVFLIAGGLVVRAHKRLNEIDKKIVRIIQNSKKK